MHTKENATLKLRKKNDLRKRTRKTDLMLDDLYMALTSFTSSSLLSSPSHPEIHSIILPCFCSVH